MFLEGDTFTELYRDSVQNLLQYGEESKPRGMGTRELCGVTLRLTDSRRNLLASQDRKLNYYFGVAEWLWMLLGMNSADVILPFNSMLREFSDDGVYFHGAYGPKLVEQFPYVLKTLKTDPDSRQAVLTIWRERPGSTRDVPCTVAMQFLVRGGKLNMVTTMRSNDAWRGLPYDVFNFTQVQAYVAAGLGLEAGWYQHQVGSFHLYDTDLERAASMVDEPTHGRWVDPSPALTWPVPPLVHAYLAVISSLNEQLANGEKARRLLTRMREEVPEPWFTYLHVLVIRWHRVLAINGPWDFLLDRCCNIKVER